jgi:hypothetical protein
MDRGTLSVRLILAVQHHPDKGGRMIRKFVEIGKGSLRERQVI